MTVHRIAIVGAGRMLATQLDQLVPWAAALRGVRESRAELARAA